MEYVIVTTSILIPLVVLDNVLFDPAGGVRGDLGYFGEQFVGWLQRLMCGVSLPIP